MAMTPSNPARPVAQRPVAVSRPPTPATPVGRPTRPTPTGAPPTPLWQQAIVLAVVSATVLAAGFGVGTFLQRRDGSGPAPGPEGAAAGTSGQTEAFSEQSEPFALYITDAIGNLSALDVKVGGVFVGPDLTPMTVLNPAFDLAGLQGPGEAIQLATGVIPPSQREPVIVVFERANATIDGVASEVPLLAPLVLTAGSAASSADKSLLMDVDLGASLKEQNGTLAFQPTLQAIYKSDLAEVTDPASWGLPIEAASEAVVALGPAGLTGEAAKRAAAAVPIATTTGVDATDAVPQTRFGWLVQFADANVSRERMVEVLESDGTVFIQAMVNLPVAYVLATEMQAKALEKRPMVLRVEREQPLVYDDLASHAALRVPSVIDPVLGLKDANGRPVRGTGIGVAVVDTGIDATHPDLPYAPMVPGGVVRANYKMVSQEAVPLPNTDTSSGHGTHVASIVAGQGNSDVSQKGVAPGATLYGFGIGESATTLWAAQAFDWIATNGQAVDPPIRVVTNSWNTGTTYDPNSIITQFVNYLVDQGVVVVFSAGNLGGDGSAVQTSAQCQIPKAGVICVAAFDDQNTGSRDGKLPSYTSRGATARPETWPDVSAPGSAIRAARPLLGIQTGVATSSYTELTGTSQAAPHVAGIVALMLQADGSLTPAQVERMIEVTAYKYADGGAYSTSPDLRAFQSHHAKGYGLADAYSAVQAALA